jgi:Mg/Co/Ni transporter MgtE
MTKEELIERIRQINNTARVDFLNRFDEQQLREYLEHLMQITCHQVAACQ